MYEDLEPIASLKFGKLIESVSKETQESLQEYMRQAAARGVVLSGAAESEKLRITLDGAERRCRGLYEIWLDLIMRKNGRLKREDVEFIMARVEQCTASGRNIPMSPPGLPESARSALSSTASRRMQQVESSIRRDLEIQIREQESFGEKERPHGAAALGAVIGGLAGGGKGSAIGATIARGVETHGNEVDRHRRVWVVHGRDERLRSALFTFLRSIALEPLEFSQARSLTRKPTPYIGEILDAAFEHAQAVVVLLSADDEARLRADLVKPEDPSYERELTGQARPNVLFEGGMALISHRGRTVLVQVGDIRPFSDIAGKHVVRIDDTVGKRQELAHRLKDAGCPINLTGTDWHTAGDFSAPRFPQTASHTADERFEREQEVLENLFERGDDLRKNAPASSLSRSRPDQINHYVTEVNSWIQSVEEFLKQQCPRKALAKFDDEAELMPVPSPGIERTIQGLVLRLERRLANVREIMINPEQYLRYP